MDDLKIAQLAHAAYEKDITPYPWTYKWAIGDIYVGLLLADDGDVLAFRGSKTPDDWFHDLFAIPHNVTDHLQLGKVHAGFFDRLDRLLPLIVPLVRPGLTICGHSLGGARALLMAALLSSEGIPPYRVVTFGAPRPGYTTLSDILAPIKITAYRNGTGAMRSDGESHDIVTDLPLHIPGLAPFIHPREPLSNISVVPLPNDALGPFAWHRMELYLTGM